MAALNGAIALAQVDDIAMLVRQNLELDVMRALDIFLNEYGAVSESGEGLAGGHFHIFAQLGIRPDDAESAPSTTGAGFDHDRVAGFFGEGQGLFNICHAAMGARDDRNPVFFRKIGGFNFAAHGVDGGRRGSDEGNAGSLAQLGKLRVLGKKAVAGMDGIRSDSEGEIDDLLLVEEALHRPRADEVGFISLLDVDAGGIRLGIDSDRGDIQFAAGADDAHGDFAAICD
jgi:hypothetical protein